MDRTNYLKRLGETVEPGGRAPAPPPLRLVQQFLNTHNHELGPEWDRLRTPPLARSWLIHHGLLPRGARLTVRELAVLHQFRAAVRDLVVAQDAGTAGARRLRTLNRLGRRALLRVVLEAGGDSRLEPTGTGVERIMGDLLVILHRAMVDGSWSRLKACRQCEWLFFDRSKNRSADWCSMSVCGNRVKNRAYRRKVAAGTTHQTLTVT
jgi:CGNR zinc finger protein/putative stress-induced transcription regulator